MPIDPYASIARRDLQKQEDWNAQLQQQQSQAGGGYQQAMQKQGYQYNPNQQGSTNVPHYRPDDNALGVRMGGNMNSNAGAMEAQPDAWWGDRENETRMGGNGISQINLSEFADNPEAVARLWTARHGYGDNTRNAISQFSDPRALLYGSGQMSGSALNDTGSQLELTGQLFANSMGAGQDSSYFDPRAIVNKIVNLRQEVDPARGGAPTGQSDPFAAAMLDPDPKVQIQNTIRFLGAALQGVMPRDSFQSYMQLLQKEAESFSLWRLQNPQLSGTFNKWIGDRLGPTGGL